jgi:ankyrin repeat protein
MGTDKNLPRICFFWPVPFFFFGQEEIASLLIARGANVNTTLPGGFTPLHDAVYVGRKNMVQLLIANGARVYAANKQGKRPLDLAVVKGNQEIIDLMKPLHRAAQTGALTKVKAFLGKNPDCVNIKDENGWYPLHLAIKGGHVEIFKFLVARGADINARGTCGVTPLRLAKIG